MHTNKSNTLQHAVQHTAPRCNTLQHAATRCNTLQRAAIPCVSLAAHLKSKKAVDEIHRTLRRGQSVGTQRAASYQRFHTFFQYWFKIVFSQPCWNQRSLCVCVWARVRVCVWPGRRGWGRLSELRLACYECVASVANVLHFSGVHMYTV